MRNFDSSPPRQVPVEVELLLQLERLIPGIRLSTPLPFKLTSHPGVQWAWQRRISIWRGLLRGCLLCVHRLLVHWRHLRLMLHVIYWVHEVLLVGRDAMLHHVLLWVHMVRHLLRLLEGRTTRHTTCRRCCCLELTRRIHCRRWRLVTVWTIAIRFRTHMTHLRRTVRPVSILFHLLIVAQSIIGWKPGVGHARRRLGRVMVLRRPKLLLTAL